MSAPQEACARPGPVSAAARFLAHVLIRFYQLTLSAFMGRQCRYMPSCSTYMDDAIQRHGLWLGGWMGVARLCRCRPGGASGYDPAPERAQAPFYAPWRAGDWRGPRMCEPVAPDERPR